MYITYVNHNYIIKSRVLQEKDYNIYFVRLKIF